MFGCLISHKPPIHITTPLRENRNFVFIAKGLSYGRAGGPGSRPGRHVGFVVDKAALEQVFSECFSFPCQSSFHQFLHHHNHPGLAQ
jgi:hypothetical protein